MPNVAGYELLDSVYESENSIISRARDPQSGRAVFVKRLPDAFPTPEKIARFRREFEMTRGLAGEGVIEAIALERSGGALAMVVEDFGGQSLAAHLKDGELSLNEALRVGEAAASALARVHAGHLMHKDVNPANLVWNRETGDVKLIDFGISTELTREAPAILNPNVLEGTLAYMSPEQTGRMNRAMDYRTDLYSLGVTLYRLLSGRLPFRAADPMELVHAHLAIVPKSLSDLAPKVPTVVSDLVDKLLEKAAEDRYQSAVALRHDLSRCLEALKESGTVQPFLLAEGDISNAFAIPEKLYGRSGEIAELLGAFDRVADGARELMLVAGYSGIGKSALVKEVHKPIVGRRGYFIGGKFDQFNRNIPYASLIQAFGELVGQLLTESADQLTRWRSRLVEATAPNTAVLIDVLPEVELIVGPQEPVAELAPLEAQNRFNLVFEQFVRVFAAAEHPLTVFLDDLQWADPPSLRLIKRFMTDAATGHLLLIGAYRDNEVDPTHPFILTLDEIREAGAPITTITLAPLAEANIRSLLADTLHRSPSAVDDLTSVCVAKTGGNPFFLNQFLRALYEEGVIDFDAEGRRWIWDVAGIEAMEITDNVVDLMARKIRTLDEVTQRVLQLAACIGASFDLNTLSVVNDASARDTADALWDGLKAGLVVPIGGDWKFLQEEDEDRDGSPSKIQYRWLHDRVQQAAYSLIPDEQKQAVHLTVGRLMLAKLSPAEQAEQLFSIVGHLNTGSSRIDDQDERLALARLNLRVGRRATASAAYAPAARFVEQGLALLGDGWSTEYELARDLHTEAAAAWNLVPDFAAMERHTGAVIDNARDVLDQVRAYEIRILGLQAQAKVVEGVQAAVEILGRLGVTFPEEPGNEDVGAALGAVAAAIGDRTVAQLVEVEANGDPVQVAAIRVLVNITSTAYIGAPALFPLIVCKAVELSVQGDTGASAYAYVTYGIILCGVLEQFAAGNQFGDLGQEVIRKYDAQEYAARTKYIPDCFLRFWVDHARGGWAGHGSTYQLGLETGDQEFAAWPLMMRTHQGYFMGLPLAEREVEARDYVDKCDVLKQRTSQYYAAATRQAMHNLMGCGNEDPTLLVGDAFDETHHHPVFIENAEAFGICNTLVHKVVLSFLFRKPEQTLDLSAELAPWAGSMVSTVHVPVFHFYDALNRLELHALEGNEDDTDGHLARAREALAALERYNVAAPQNWAHKVSTLTARLAWIDGDRDAAHAGFKAAIEQARSNGYLNEEAVALELLGRLWLEHQEPEIAGLWLSRARHTFELWGAAAKVAELDVRYGELLRTGRAQDSGRMLMGRAMGKAGGTITNTAATSTTGGGALDLGSVLKASRAISSEVRLAGLLKTLMEIVVENAGATNGVLLLEEGGDFTTGARAATGSPVETVLDLPTLDEGGAHLPRSLVQYVSRTREAVVLDDASRPGKFSNDPYFAENEVRSVLASPVLHGGRITGILYLENNLATGAFTEERLAVLEMLSRQVAVSMENARLFEEQRLLADSFARFVPTEFLQHLGRKSIVDVQLGDAVQRDITVLFSDLRSFTTLSEGMSPQDNFRFLNRYLEVMEPAIEEHGGFVDKYIGDAIMALFAAGPDSAVAAAVAMQRALEEHNAHERTHGRPELIMGIGVHTGPLILGTLGSPSRMETTVIGDTVNLASRLEGQTKPFGSGLLISEQTRVLLRRPEAWELRRAGRVRVKGKTESTAIWDVLDAGANCAVRVDSRPAFEQGLDDYLAQEFSEAAAAFGNALAADPTDKLARLYADRCERLLRDGVPEGWDGVDFAGTKI